MVYFLKMNGLGNDFVIIDQRETSWRPHPEQIQRIAHRRLGIGCDQVIQLEDPSMPDADVMMRIHNADGKEAGACGNAMRCVGLHLSKEFKRSNVKIETVEGLLTANVDGEDAITVDLGAPKLDWASVPLASKPKDLFHLDITAGVLTTPAAVSVGNPHMVFFVEDVNGIDIETLGAKLTSHPLFAQGANVDVVQVLGANHLRMRVYERGAGVTMACGTGAAASVVAAHHRGLCERGVPVRVDLDGGVLDINYRETLLIKGPARYVCEGTIDASLLENVSNSCIQTTQENTTKLNKTKLKAA